MRKILASVLGLAVTLALPASSSAQDAISVDVRSAIADVSRRPVGMNVNFLLDHDANRSDTLRTLAQALKDAGVKYLRYPGGEKADAYLWSVPPYDRPVPTLARWATGEYPVNQEWPSYDRALVATDGHTFRTRPLDFDDFMAVCGAIDCIPTIVVCYDSMYKPAQPGGVAPTREQLLETAREWVRYANITKGYNVRYWEIGNESYLRHYNGSATASDYAHDLIEFSSVMKAVDPTIHIGANGESESWWRTILSTASGAIDFLAVHSYPAQGWGSYDHYKNNTVNLMAVVQTAQHAINTYAPAADRSRLTIAATEVNSADWSGSWPHVNDLGHAVVLFDMFGAHLRHPNVAFTQLWNTRWSGNDTATTPALWDALDRHNALQATGRAAAIWGQFLEETMVSSSSTAMVRSYATYSPSSRQLTVFLINKDTVPRTGVVTLTGLGTVSTVSRWVFSGEGPNDTAPIWAYRGPAPASGNVVSVPLAPVSVTVLDITPHDSAHQVPGSIQAEDFDEGAYWDSTTGNSGHAYRATDVDIEWTTDSGGGFNVGWIAAGEWLEYTIHVSATGLYDLSARVASPYEGRSFRVLVDGTDATGSVTVPRTGAWQSWQTVTRPFVHLSAGSHRLRFVAITSGFNLNWISLSPSAAVAHPVPGTIQAEDFDEDAYWDSTSGNQGGAYRTTDVDIQPTGDAGGGFNVGWIDSGEWLEYTIHVHETGYYDLSARVASPHVGRSFRVLVNGTDATGSIAVPYTGGWQIWQTVTPSPLHLQAGTHRLRFVAITNGFNLNWMALSASALADTGPGTIQAEDFDEGAYWDSTPGNAGGAYRATDVDIQPTTDIGGGFNIGWIDAGEWLDYTIHIHTAGHYDLSARVASPHSGKAFRVLVNGTDVTGSVSVPNTGGWQTWQTLTRANVPLAAGTHRLRLLAITNGFNVNWISLQRGQ